MSKTDLIQDYLNKNYEKGKEQLIKDIQEQFNLSVQSASKYYRQWDNLAVSAEEISTNKKRNEKLKLKSAVFVGEYGEYRLNEDGSVWAGNEKFKNAKDVEEYRSKEISNFMARLGEILDVMEMGANS